MNAFPVLMVGAGQRRGDEGLWRIDAPEVLCFSEQVSNGNIGMRR